MAVDPDFQAFALELLEGLGGVSAKRMFGGAGLFRDGRMFALLAEDALWIKADAEAAPAFEAEGCPEFVYGKARGDPGVLHYRRLPDGALDDPDEAVRWARLGVESAARSAAKAPKARPPPKT